MLFFVYEVGKREIRRLWEERFSDEKEKGGDPRGKRHHGNGGS